MKLIARILLLLAIITPQTFASIGSTTTWVQYVLSTNPQTLTIPFVFQSSSDVLVLDSKASPPVVLIQNSDYTILGGNGNQGTLVTIAGGSNAVKSGDIITISRRVPLTQTTNFTNGGPVTATMIGNALDKLTTITQQLNLVGSNSLQFQPDEQMSGVLPLSLRKNTFLGFDDTGKPTFAPIGGIVTTVTSPLAVSTVTLLRNLPVVSVTNGTPVQLLGYNSVGDGGQGILVWNALSTASDDGGVTFAATGVSTGRWVRQISGPVNVRWFGAAGNGTTDDTAAIQGAVNYALTIVTNFAGKSSVFIPQGVYKITSEIVLPFSTGFEIYGDSRGDVTIDQATNNQAIFVINNTLTHSWTIHSMSATWATQQTTSNVKSYFLRFDNDIGSGSGTTCFSWQIDDVAVAKGYRGIGYATTITGSASLWNCRLDRFNTANMSGTSVMLQTPSTATGVPNVTLSNLYLTGVGCTEPAINVGYANELQIYNCDVEQYTDMPALVLNSCNTVIDGLHLENWTYSNSTAGTYPGVIHAGVIATQCQIDAHDFTYSGSFTCGGGYKTGVVRAFQSSVYIGRGFGFTATNAGFDGTSFYELFGQGNQWYLDWPNNNGRYNIEDTSLGDSYNYRDSLETANVQRLVVGGTARQVLRSGFLTTGNTTATSNVIVSAALAANSKVGDLITCRAFTSVTGGAATVSITAISSPNVTVSANADASLTGVQIARTMQSPGSLRALVLADSGGWGVIPGPSSVNGCEVMWRNLGADRFGHAVGSYANADGSGGYLSFWRQNAVNYGSETPGGNEYVDVAPERIQYRSGSTLTSGWFHGTGSPETIVTAPVGSLFSREDGGANTTLYVKESGSGNTGWIAK